MADLTGPQPSFKDLISAGLYQYDLRPVEIEPTPGNRGLERHMKGAKWCCTLVSFDHARPMVKAIRLDPVEADLDARLRFMALFSGRLKAKGELPDPISDTTEKKTTRQKKAEVVPDLDDEAASLI